MLIMKRETRDLKRTVHELAAHIRANVGFGMKPDGGDPTAFDRLKAMHRHADAEMKKIEFVCRTLDGGKTAGLAHSLLFQPLADAQAARYELQERVHGALIKPFDELSLERRRRYAQRVTFLHSPRTGKAVTLSRRNLLSVALNMGNEGNRERLLRGYGWTEAQVLAKLSELLDEGDVELIGHIWRTVDSLWPQIAELSQRHTGLPPQRVEAKPFTLVLRDGGKVVELAGGYYPIVKDQRLSYLARQIEERELAAWEGNFFAPVVEHGFTKSRGKDMSPLALSLDVVPTHIGKVVHYLTHYEAIRAVDRILQYGKESDPDTVRAAIIEGIGGEYFDQFRPWLESIAADGRVGEPLKVYERFMRHLRYGSSIVLLFGKIPTAAKQFLGLVMSRKEVKRKHLVSGVRRFLRYGWTDVAAESPEFKFFDKQLDRDVRELFTVLDAQFGELGRLRAKVVHFAAAPLMLAQKTVNAITWYGAHEQAIAEGHPDPAAYADSVVRLTQTGGGPKDLAAVQRGSEWWKTLTVMFSWRSVAYNQLTELQPGAARWEKATAYAWRFWYVALLPILIEQVLMNGIGEDEDPEDVAKRVALEAALFPARTVPGFGQLAEGLVEQRVPTPAPWVDTTYRAMVAAGKALDPEDELTRTDYREVVKFVGMATHTPTSALWNVGDYFDRLLSGELEEPVQDLVFRNPSRWE